jgi:hypothetical protein
MFIFNAHCVNIIKDQDFYPFITSFGGEQFIVPDIGRSKGWRVQLDQQIKVQELCFYMPNSTYMYQEMHPIGIFDLDKNLLTNTTLPQGQCSNLQGSYCCQSIVPIMLEPGHQYDLIAWVGTIDPVLCNAAIFSTSPGITWMETEVNFDTSEFPKLIPPCCGSTSSGANLIFLSAIFSYMSNAQQQTN